MGEQSTGQYPGVNQIGLIDEVIQYQDEYLADLDVYNEAKKSAEETGNQDAVNELTVPEYKFHPTPGLLRYF